MIASQFPWRRAVAAALALALVAWAGAGRASADVFPITYVSRGAGIITDMDYNGANVAAFVGQFDMQIVGGPSFVSFCVDPADSMHAGTTYLVTPRSTSDGLTAGNEIAYLYNKYGQLPLTDSHQAAGLQLAMWELVIDGAVNPGDSPAIRLATGNFQYNAGLGFAGFDAAAYSDALSFLTEAESNSAEGTWLDSSPGGVVGPKGQGVLLPQQDPEAVPPPTSTLLPQQGAAEVPKPASALLLGLGLLSAGAYRRFRRR